MNFLRYSDLCKEEKKKEVGGNPDILCAKAG